MIKILSIEKFIKNIKNIYKRFPIAIIIIFLISSLFFVLLHSELSNIEENNILRYILSLIITFFLTIWVYLNSENNEKINKNIIQFFPILFWILFFVTFKWNLNNEDNAIHFLLTLAWIIWYFYISPFLKKIFKNSILDEIYYSYFYKISVIFLISFILWWALFLLWSIWITTIFTLFDLKEIFSEKIYWDWAIIALSFITPIFTLTQIPDKKTFNENNFIENKFFSFLVKYIAVPFIYIYFIILYAYSIKVLLNFHQWPKWEVSWIVIWFSIFGFLIYMFSSVIENENKFIKFFRKYFPLVVIPQLFMLFYAIYLRIVQYDITINRYFVVIFWIWLLVISLYFSISKQKQIHFIPTILTIFTIIISIGPWWVYSLPESRQLQRLENNLIKANILQNWKIVPLKNYSDIKENLSKDIYNWINYLCNYNDCKSIKILFNDIYLELDKKNKQEFENLKSKDKIVYKNDEKNLKAINSRIYNWPNSWEIVSEISEKIKVKSYFEINNNEVESIYLYLNPEESIYPIDINWYKKIHRINNYTLKKDLNTINYTSKNKIEIKENWTIFDEIDLSDVSKKLWELYKNTKNNNISKENMTYELSWKKWIYKLILENYNIKNPSYTWTWKENIYSNIDWYLLTK